MKSAKFNHYCIPISCLVFLFLLRFPLFLHAEYLSFPSVSVFSLNSSSAESGQYSLNFEDALVLQIQERIQSFIAVDIEILQSKTFPVSFVVYSLEDAPSNNVGKYRVQEIAKEEVHRKKTTFRIAHEDRVDCAEEATIKLLSCTISEKNPLLIKFDAPSASSRTTKQDKLSIKIKPVLQDFGGIRFNLIYPANVVYFPSLPKNEAEAKKNIAVRIDEKHVTEFSKPCMMRPGEHKVQVDSHFYRSEVITCIVEKGKIEIIDIELKPLAPLITVEGPGSVEVFLDEVAIKLPFSANVEAGEHILRFKMEGYETVRHIATEQGKKYLLNLALEINIIER